MKLFVLILSIFLILNFVHATLSPISKDEKKKNKKAKDETKNGKKKLAEKDVFQRQLVKRDITPEDILQEANVYSKHFNIRHYVPGEILGYITPWNSGGYDRAVKFHKKFDMISPVWFTIRGKEPFKVPTHDIQKTWLHAMEEPNNEYHSVKIIPRILFEGWSKDHIEEMFGNLQKQRKFIKLLVELADTYSFHGYVLEIWNQFLFARVSKELTIALINLISNGLREHDLDIILAVPPKRGMKKEMELFTKSDFDELSSHVKYFSIMTYDFSSVQKPGPNAPIDWIRDCIETLVPNSKDIKRSQILMGLNFYGYHYTPTGGGAITGSQYLSLLKDFKGKFQWDDHSEEHFFEIKSKENHGYVFFPTLYSLMTRLELAVEMKTGVAIWELGQGLDYFMDII